MCRERTTGEDGEASAMRGSKIENANKKGPSRVSEWREKKKKKKGSLLENIIWRSQCTSCFFLSSST